MRGFTLIELLVAVTIFSFVILLVGVIILGANAINERLIAKKVVYESINLVLDDMSREMMQGSRYRCLDNLDVPSFLNVMSNDEMKGIYVPKDCTGGRYGIAFKASDYSSYAQNLPVSTPIPMIVYSLEDGKIKRYTGGIAIDPSNGTTTTSSNIASTTQKGTVEVLTDNNITVTSFRNNTKHTSSYSEGDLGQPYSQIIIEGITNTYPIVSFIVQTTVAQREPDN